jgi:hypothetical protein
MPFSEIALFPLAPHYTPNIQVKATKIIVLKSALLNFFWIDKVLKRFVNVTTLEVATIDITGRNKIKGLLKSVLKSNISLVLVNASCIAYWKKVFKSIPRTRQLEFGILGVDYEQTRRHLLSIDQTVDEINPLYSSLSNPSVITGLQSWMHPLNETLLTKLSGFKAEAEQLLKRKGSVHTIIEVLSFNSIYLMAPGCFSDYLFNIIEWQQIVSNCRNNFKKHTLTSGEHTKINDAIERFAQAIYYSFTEIDLTIDQLRGTDLNRCILDMLANLGRKIDYGMTTTCMDEDTFTMQIIDPILNAFINNTIPNINYYGSTHVLHESNIRKHKQDKVMGRKADRSVVVKTRSGNTHTVFICEIKTDSKCKGRPDLAKTGSMMKDALDHALLCHVSRKDYSVLGLLIEGGMASVLSLDLPASGLYRLVEVGTISNF